MHETDLQLLRRYGREGAEDAFAEIVCRHVGLVHSAALRQVRSPQLAEEIAQSAFTDLARNSQRLAPDTVLAAWLYQVTRRTAIDVVRRETRRQAREQIATEMNAPTTDAAWLHIEPLLDEAMDGLDDTDRAAILLRYFENKSLREVGQTLGVSDDAAQKRVSRAVERLREFFARRGVAVGAGGLAAVLSANAIQAAPVGLAGTISATATVIGTATAATATATTTTAAKAIAMTALQKTLVAGTIAVLAGAGIYEARQAATLRRQNAMLQLQQAPQAERSLQLQRDHEETANRVASLLEENHRLKANPNAAELLRLRGEVTRLGAAANQEQIDPSSAATKALLARMNRLKQWLDQHPEEKIPELQFATENNWMFCALDKLESEGDYRLRLSMLRSGAKNEFAMRVIDSLKQFASANSNRFPTDLSQLVPYFSSAIDDAILSRWEILPANNFTNIHLGGNWVIAEKGPPVDEAKDFRLVVGAAGVQNVPFK